LLKWLQLNCAIIVHFWESRLQISLIIVNKLSINLNGRVIFKWLFLRKLLYPFSHCLNYHVSYLVLLCFCPRQLSYFHSFHTGYSPKTRCPLQSGSKSTISTSSKSSVVPTYQFNHVILTFHPRRPCPELNSIYNSGKLKYCHL